MAKRVYIGYPRIAQDAVNRSTLNITRMAFSEPTPNTIRVNQTQVLGNKAIYHPKIFEFNATITLVGSSAPLAVVVVPQSQAEDGAVIHFDAVLNLQDINAVTNFSRAVLSSEEFQLNVFGRPQLQEGPLPKTTVTFNKTITMKGNPPFCFIAAVGKKIYSDADFLGERNGRPQRLRITKHDDLTHTGRRRHKHERNSLHP